MPEDSDSPGRSQERPNHGKSIRVDEQIYRLVLAKRDAMAGVPPYRFVTMGEALRELLREKHG